MSKLLVVVDCQHDFIDGALGSNEAQKIIPNVIAAIKETEDDGGVVVFTRDTHQENYLETQEGKNLPVKHCIVNSNGWQIAENIINASHTLNSYSQHTIFDKITFGSVELGDYVQRRNFDEVELCGLDSDICIISNALFIKTLCPEIKITVDASCTAGTSIEANKAALLVMKSCQIKIINE